MGNFWTNPVRHPEDVGVQVIRRTINLSDFTANGGLVPIGAMEAGSIPLHASVTVTTAFNSGTSDAMDVGTSGTAAGFAAASGTLVQATGWKPSLSGTLSGIPLATDQIVYAKLTSAGTAATTGKVVVIMTFLPKRDGEGTAWPGN